MPELSRFYGIVIKMYYNDHNPPHFHAEYGSSQMVVDVHTFAVIGGRLPLTLGVRRVLKTPCQKAYDD